MWVGGVALVSRPGLDCELGSEGVPKSTGGALSGTGAVETPALVWVVFGAALGNADRFGADPGAKGAMA